ncbi:MAG: hydrogenase maturation protease [Hyphomicrobium sp.]
MIAVIGCGNANRSDDAAGLDVIRMLRQSAVLSARSDVKLFDAGTDGMAVMFAARGCKTLMIIDCCATGAAPGATFEVPGHELESQHQPFLNLHDFRWDHAIHAGRQIYREAFPTDVTAFLIEGQSLALGIGLSAPVAAAAERTARAIEARIAVMPPSLTSPNAHSTGNARSHELPQ